MTAGRSGIALQGAGIYRRLAWSRLFDRVAQISLGLTSLGVHRGDRVAIVGDPPPDWVLTDFAAQCLGAISFGLYPTSSRDEVEPILRHGGASVLVAEDPGHVDKVLPIADRLPSLKKIVVIDESNMFAYWHPALMTLRLHASSSKRDQRHGVRDPCFERTNAGRSGRVCRRQNSLFFFLRDRILYGEPASPSPENALIDPADRGLRYAPNPIPQDSSANK